MFDFQEEYKDLKELVDFFNLAKGDNSINEGVGTDIIESMEKSKDFGSKNAEELKIKFKEQLARERQIMLNFIKGEQNKDCHICKKTLECLTECIDKKFTKKYGWCDEPLFIKSISPDFDTYSSGRKAYFFDEWGSFIQQEPNERLDVVLINFSREEICSYAKSYRLWESSLFPSGYPKYRFVQIFDFKSENL